MRWRIVAAAISVAVVFLLTVPAGQAHANYFSSQPPQGARLATAPREVSVVFSENVDTEGSGLSVHASDGRRVDDGDIRFESGERPRLAVILPDDLGDGAYRVDWWALSRVDHHTTRGTFGFAVGNYTPAPLQQSSNDEASALSIAGRTAFFLGLSLAVGSLVFASIVARHSTHLFASRAGRLGAGLVAAGSLGLLADAASASAIPFSAWTASPVLRNLLVRLGLAIGLVATSWWQPKDTRLSQGLTAALVLGVALYSARAGHASIDGIAAVAVDAIHLLATTTWVGSLALFAYLLVRETPSHSASLVGIGRRFSRTALTCVIVMGATGVLLGVLILGLPQVRDPLGWFDGTYGKSLLGKLLLAATMIGLAGINRFRFLGRWFQEPLEESMVESVRRRFGRFVAAEAGIGVVVVALAALLTSTAPPSSIAPPGFHLTAEGGEFYAIVEADDPPQAGAFSDLRFYIAAKEDNQPVERDTCGRQGCIVVEIVPPGAEEHEANETQDDVHKGGEHRTLTALEGGWWSVPGVLFVEEGHYELMVEIQTEYVYFDTVSFEFHVPSPSG